MTPVDRFFVIGLLSGLLVATLMGHAGTWERQDRTNALLERLVEEVHR